MMIKRILVICEGTSECSYLAELQRVIEDELQVPGQMKKPKLKFVPFPRNRGVGTGAFSKVMAKYEEALKESIADSASIWVDSDIYIRNDSPSRSGDKYAKRNSSVPVFAFSYFNFEDFLSLHLTDDLFSKWKNQVLYHDSSRNGISHSECPLMNFEHSVQFQKIIPSYSKPAMPFDLSKSHLENLRRHLRDPDVQRMEKKLQPGINFGKFILDCLDSFYPNQIK